MKKAIDLTHPINEKTIAWPSATQFTTKQVIA
jgi:kynurenine formamidase